MELSALIHNQRTKSIVFEAGLAALLFFSDPLGIMSQKTHFIDTMIATVSQYSYKSKASEMLAVVLIDQATLNSWQVDWPITDKKVAELIHGLACAGAVGVFFDFTASKEFNLAKGQEDLVKEIADSSSNERNCVSNKDPEKKSPPKKLKVFFGKAEGIDTPLAKVLDSRDASFWIDAGLDNAIYPAGRTDFPDQPLRTSQVTPAFGIVRSVPEIGMGAGADSWINPIALKWSGLVNSQQHTISDTAGCRGEIDWMTMFSNIVGLTQQKKYERCPPILTLNADDLFRDQDYIAASGGNNPAIVLGGRFVFVGVHLAGLNDQILSPVHGYLPGVYRHAMATDNLISYGANYPTVPTPWSLGLAVVVIYVVIEAAKHFSGGSDNHLWILVWFACLLGFMVIICYMRWPLSLGFAVFGYYWAYLVAAFVILKVSTSKSKRASNVQKERRR